MKTVLVVDDDRVILSTLISYLASLGEEFELLGAGDGRQALEILERQPVDLLLTDLYMPVMDGFELLAHMTQRFSQVPVIVMSGYEAPQVGDGSALRGALHYLEKPFELSGVGETVRETLARTSSGHLSGVSLLGFLQLLNFEKKSCLLTVTSGAKAGRVDVCEGELWNADHGRLRGESAIFEILAWEDCGIEVGVPRKSERLVFRSLHGVILVAAKEEDERQAPARHSDSGISTVPIALAERELGQLPLQLPPLFERSALKSLGAIGLALLDLQQGEMVGYRCFQYWPDFSDRAVVGVASLRRRLELDDGGQVEEVLTTLEALFELWIPLGPERRMVFYALSTREAGLEAIRSEIVGLSREVRALIASSSGVGKPTT